MWRWARLRTHTRHPYRWQPVLVEVTHVYPFYAVGPGIWATTADVVEWGDEIEEPPGLHTDTGSEVE